MKYRSLISFTSILVLFFSSTGTYAVEYNVWYTSNGILYDTTQTGQSSPVLISLPEGGNVVTSMVITYESPLPCDKIPVMQPLKIDMAEVRYRYDCSYVQSRYFVSYLVDDPAIIAFVLSRLRADFTVVLMHDIKIWASNINKPVYGNGNWLQN